MNAGAARVLVLGLAVLAGCGTETPFSRGAPLPPAEVADGGTDGGSDAVPDGGPTPDAGPSAVSFKNDVHNTLVNKCQGCHSEGPGGFYVIGDVQTDYTAAFAQVNLAAPEQSKLYVNPTGLGAHGGGTVIAPSSDAAQQILTWIQQGAEDN